MKKKKLLNRNSFFGTKNYILNYENNVKYIFLNIYSKKCSWLLDTGASLSAIRSSILSKHTPIHKDPIVINGIGGKTYSEGYVYLTLQALDGTNYEHKFYLFEELPCKSDGIIGLDFLNNFYSIIDLEKNILMLTNEKQSQIPLYTSPKLCTDYITIPARCETIHYIKLNSDVKEDSVIVQEELQENLFLASLIVKPKNNIIPIRLMNTSDKEIIIPIFQPQLLPLKEYNVCSFDKCTSNSTRAKTLLQSLKLDHLGTSERNSIESICSKYADIFYLPGDKLTTTNLCEQSINLKRNVNPVYIKPYRLPHSLKPEVDKQIKQMLADDIIEPSQSEWSSPILLVPKKSDDKNNKKWRLVIDYRKLNEVIQDDKFPLPNITEILDSLSGAIYFSHLDLSQSYYQCSLKPESRPITSFTTSTGQFQMKRLPMGLKISPSAFSRVMSVAMSGLNYINCFIYLDDCVCFGRNLESHNKNLIEIFERLRKVNLKLNPSKCQFLKTELLYLGHTISSKGIQPDQDKIKTIQNYPIPTNVDELRRFVAMCNYYRKFIKNFAELTNCLNKLCRRNVKYEWTEQCEISFNILKNALINPPILQYPDFSKEFILQTDASGTAIGAVLCNNNMRAVAYASRPLNKAELNYPTIQKELLAIVWSVKYFRPYLFGRTFTIMTDHKPLIYLFGLKDPSSRLLKFRLALEEYDFKVVYVKGKENVIADALSRISMTSQDLKAMNERLLAVTTRAQAKKVKEAERKNESGDDRMISDIPSIDPNNWPDQPSVVEILRIPSGSVELSLIQGKELRKMKEKKYMDVESECFAFNKNKNILYVNLDFKAHYTRDVFVEKLRKICEKLEIREICIIKKEDNALFIRSLIEEIKSKNKYTGPRICILKGIKRIDSDEEKQFIMNDYHLLPTSGHAGIRRMVNNIKRKFYWPGIENDVKSYVRKCEKCQKSKHSRHIKEPLVITTTASSALEKVFLDIIGPLDRDLEDNKYILTIQCELSKFVEAYPLRNKETVSIAKNFVNNFILRFGIPKVITTDRGTEFISDTMEQVCKLLNIEKLSSTAYHHQTIGSLENAHKHLGSFLRIQCDNHPETWSQWLPFWCFTYNNTIHSSTRYAPYELVFGKSCEIPSRISSDIEPLYNPDNYSLELKYRLQTANRDARENLLKSKEKRKQKYDKKVNKIKYKPNDMLLVKNETGGKLDTLYNGPYLVIEEQEPNVKILRNNKIEIIHKNRTKLFVKDK